MGLSHKIAEWTERGKPETLMGPSHKIAEWTEQGNQKQ